MSEHQDGAERDAQIIADAINSGAAIVCYTKCWGCMFGQHYDPPEWHTWADGDDVEHAFSTGQEDPRKSRCGCYCAEAKP